MEIVPCGSGSVAPSGTYDITETCQRDGQSAQAQADTERVFGRKLLPSGKHPVDRRVEPLDHRFEPPGPVRQLNHRPGSKTGPDGGNCWAAKPPSGEIVRIPLAVSSDPARKGRGGEPAPAPERTGTSYVWLMRAM